MLHSCGWGGRGCDFSIQQHRLPPPSQTLCPRVYWVFSVCHFFIFSTLWRELQGPGHVCAVLRKGSKPMEGRRGDWGTGPWKGGRQRWFPGWQERSPRKQPLNPPRPEPIQGKRDDGEALGKCCQKERETSRTVCLSTLMGGMLLQSTKALGWISDCWTDIKKCVGGG